MHVWENHGAMNQDKGPGRETGWDDESSVKVKILASLTPVIIACCESGAELNSLHNYIISSSMTAPRGVYSHSHFTDKEVEISGK